MPDAENVSPDTIPNIVSARSLSHRPLADRMTPFASIGRLLRERAEAHPESNFLTFYDDVHAAARYSYADFYAEARRAASLLSQVCGLKAGDRVATLMVNDPRTVVIYFGAWLLGATVVPLNCAEENEQLLFILQNSGAKALFVMADQADRCLHMRDSLPDVSSYLLVGDDAREGFIGFDSELRDREPIDPPDIGPDAECLIVYTSGTTGAPKGVVLEQVNLLVDAMCIADWHRFGPDDRAMCVLPIHHVNGIVVTLMTPLYSGGSVVLNRRFSALKFWRILADERCTYASVVPTVLAFLCERHASLASLDLSSLRHIICGAGPLTTELAQRFQELFGVRIVHGYGLSETTCYSCFLPIDLDEAQHRRWLLERGLPSIGCPIAANEMAIHNPQGEPLPPGARGEIVIRGHNVMKHYFRRPEANRDTFAHGWFRSGDEGFFIKGEDGRDYFFITGRIKELIIRGGVNYSPFDIDEVLNAVPGVKAAMAVGFENRYYGEEVGAYVQLREGFALTEEDIIAACRERLPAAKCPKVVVFGDEFPVTSTGKYQRSKLRPLFARWQDVYFRPT